MERERARKDVVSKVLDMGAVAAYKQHVLWLLSQIS